LKFHKFNIVILCGKTLYRETSTGQWYYVYLSSRFYMDL
jgi:hypothetical protein